jgi:RsiW-degrading membrane proteinase PrsW (M82 family)
MLPAVVVPRSVSVPAQRVPSGTEQFVRLSGHVQSLPLASLIPLRAWFVDGQWRRGYLGLFLLFALSPFVLLQATAHDTDIHRVAWGFALYFAAAWLITMRALIRPERQSVWLLLRIAGFTTIVGVAVAIALEKAIQPDNHSLVQMVLGVGLPEELAKALAVYVFVFRSRNLSSMRAFLFAGAVSGLAFGVAEAVTYSSAYANAASDLNASQYTGVEVWRLLTDSLFHACMAGITAFFLGLAVRHREQAWGLGLIGLVTAAVLHGAYDRFASGWGGAAIAALILFIFVGYVSAGEDVAADYLGAEVRP